MKRLVSIGILCALSACSLKARAVDTLAEVLGDAELVYLSDEDPVLVGEALPFNLKTLETLLASSPDHVDLLLSASKSFVLYAYGYVEPEGWGLEYTDFERAEAVRHRAAKLYRRAYDYGMRALSVEHPGIEARLKREPAQAASVIQPQQVPLAVWTAAALGGAIGVSKDDPETTADIDVVGALLSRALELDPDYDHGTIHEFLLVYEAGRVGGSVETARQHYERALALGPEKMPSIWLSWAENVSVNEQNRAEFLELTEKALAFDVDQHPDNRLLNLLAQRRASWLKANVDELFLDTGT